MNAKYNVQKVIDSFGELNETKSFVIFVKFTTRINDDNIGEIKKIEKKSFIMI